MPNLSTLLAIWSALSGPAGAAAGWYLRGRRDLRATLPIITWDGRRAEIINRLDEPLFVTKIEANAPFSLGEAKFDNGGSIIPGTDVIYSASPGSNQRVVRIEPRAKISFPLLSSRADASVRFTIQSSSSFNRPRSLKVKKFTTP